MTPEEHNEIILKLNSIREDLRNIDRILRGEPEYRREGLVQIVDRHENYIKRGGAIVGFLYVVWEGFKFFHHSA